MNLANKKSVAKQRFVGNDHYSHYKESVGYKRPVIGTDVMLLYKVDLMPRVITHYYN